MVGTLCVSKAGVEDADGASLSLRSQLKSLHLVAAGYCRLDPRWHRKEDIVVAGQKRNIIPVDLPLPSHTTPFWSTRTIDLLELPERKEGSWKEAQPQPIRLPKGYMNVWSQRSSDSAASAASSENMSAVTCMERHLAFSFRVQLPEEPSPHTLVATSCRYYYTISVRLVTTDSNNPVWTEIPVSVCTAISETIRDNQQVDQETLLDIQSLQAVAHSSGLPTHMTASDLYLGFPGQWTVHRRVYSHPKHVHSIKVTDPTSDRSVCILTLLGSSPHLHPGRCLVVKLDFPTVDSQSNWLSCFQASACLQSEESSIHRINGSRQRARRLILDTAHQEIDPSTTESISLHLLVPVTAPCNLQTESIEIITTCLVDLSVASNTGKNEFQNLRLEIPFRVTHAVADWETINEEEDSYTQHKLYHDIARQNSNQPTVIHNFRYDDIVDELKLLSFSMADKCGLLPRPLFYPSIQPPKNDERDNV